MVCVCVSSQLDSFHQSFVKSAPEMPNRPLIQEFASPAGIVGSPECTLSPGRACRSGTLKLVGGGGFLMK